MKKRSKSGKIGFTTNLSNWRNPVLKSITEILGGAQILRAVSFDIQERFEEYLTEEQRSFLALSFFKNFYYGRFEKEITHRSKFKNDMRVS